eukprot:scaffold73496_cov66-Phaeocystis_antarctica.AAC.1
MGWAEGGAADPPATAVAHRRCWGAAVRRWRQERRCGWWRGVRLERAGRVGPGAEGGAARCGWCGCCTAALRARGRAGRTPPRMGWPSTRPQAAPSAPPCAWVGARWAHAPSARASAPQERGRLGPALAPPSEGW